MSYTNYLSDTEIQYLKAAGFTDRQITQFSLKFYNLFRVNPWPASELERKQRDEQLRNRSTYHGHNP